MAFRTLKKYWATIAGGGLIAGAVVLSGLTLGSRAVGDLVESGIKHRVETFSAFLLSENGHVDAFLTGISRDPDAETKIRTVALLSNISIFSIFDRDGDEVFSTRSDRYEWLLRDKAGGIDARSKLSKVVIQGTRRWPVVNDESTDSPSAVMPLIRNGTTIGYVSVTASMLEERFDYSYTLTSASASLLVILLLTTGIPALFYIRRKRKIHEADERIQFLANYDTLTHLLNRRRMQEETDRVLATSRATRERIALWFIDMDRLSEVNDALGQAAGDELLRIVANRLLTVIDRSDHLARLGGDDFAILQRHVGGADSLAMMSKRIVEVLKDPIEISGQAISPSVSMGVATMPEHGRTYSQLVQNAELAFLHHKSGKNGDFTVFEPFMDEESHSRRLIEAMMRAALESGGFELFYQPIVSGSGGALLGFEALIRMPDGNGGHIPPSVFIPIAEARGYIKAIGTWVIKEAARQAAEWPDDLFVSVNLSAVQFRDGDLVAIVEEALQTAGIEGRRLEIEVVESLLLDRSDNILGQLRALKSLGISIDMDDFGTGYSSLGYLWRFPFDKLKIDQSFMLAFTQGESGVRQILETIVSLGHHMGMKVTAEGIETQAQVDLLGSFGCDQLQGYYFGRPMPAGRVAAEILSRVRDRRDPADRGPGTQVPGAAISAA